MKVLIDHASPFLLARGGVQIQIEQTTLAMERAGVAVEFVRWWDQEQTGDVIHYFGAVPHGYMRLARQKGIPVIVTSFLSATCNRPERRLRLQGLFTRALLVAPVGNSIKAQLQWQVYHDATHHIVGLDAERQVLKTVYGVPTSRISVVPLGLDESWFHTPAALRDGNYLVTVGTICEVKRSIDLAEMAHSVKVPILFVGDPFSPLDPYWEEFRRLIDDKFVRHLPHMSNRAELVEVMSAARGFVLFSRYENWSLAAHEAAALKLPLLLPYQNWSRECFGSAAKYFAGSNAPRNAEILGRFYDEAINLAGAEIPKVGWATVASELRSIYKDVLYNSR